MIITQVEQLPKGKRKVVREDGRFLVLYAREIKGLDFAEGAEVKDEQWEIGVKGLITRGKKRIFHLLAKKDYTYNEIDKKLIKEHYDEPIRLAIIQYFEELDFINDEKYVAKYYRYHHERVSKRIMEHKLQMKGISSRFFNDVLESLETANHDFEAATFQCEKKYRFKEVSQEDFYKMVQFLSRKGFSYDVSKGVVKEFLTKKLDETL